MKKQKKIFRWDRLISYLLLIYIIYLIIETSIYISKTDGEVIDNVHDYNLRVIENYGRS